MFSNGIPKKRACLGRLINSKQKNQVKTRQIKIKKIETKMIKEQNDLLNRNVLVNTKQTRRDNHRK
jgi:hypothetical protein